MANVKKMFEGQRPLSDLSPDEMHELAGPIIDQLAKVSESQMKRMRKAASGISDAMRLQKAMLDAVSTPPITRIDLPKFEVKSMEEMHDYGSAKVLLESLNRYYSKWSERIDSERQIVIYAVMSNGLRYAFKIYFRKGLMVSL